MPFTQVPRQGYFVEFSDAPGSDGFRHTVGGKNELQGAVCLPCKRPLLLMMSLDTRDPRLEIKLTQGRLEMRISEGGEIGAAAQPYTSRLEERTFHDVPLLYCWSCGDHLDYRLNPAGGVDVLDQSAFHNAPGLCLPYEPYPRSFPSKHIGLEAVPSHVQEIIRKQNAGTLDKEARWTPGVREALSLRHQIGGEPWFLQRDCLEGDWKCSLCRGDMPFLASVADETGSKKTFHHGAYVQVVFHYCAACQVVNAYHECS